MNRPARVAIVHDYLLQVGGAERVLEELHRMWPSAPVFTTFYDRRTMAAHSLGVPASAIRTLMPSRLPHRGRPAKAWTFVYPFIWRRLDLRGFDLVISSSSFAAHHVRVAAEAKHICYCHSPARFMYGLQTEIDHRRLRRVLPILGPAYSVLLRLDQEAATRVSQYVANSEEVAGRILRAYSRRSIVVYPPVDTDAFADVSPSPDRAYFLAYGRLVASKRVDVIVQAANMARADLVVAGSGPETGRLKSLAGPNVRLTGWQSPAGLRDLMAGARAVLFAADEDFGIVPVEAMAAGIPVIAFGHGGARESVVEGSTGEFFTPQTAGALAETLLGFDHRKYDPSACRARAAYFDAAVFRSRFQQVADRVLDGTIASAPVFG